MTTTKTATLTFRIDPKLKEALRTAAHQEHRSIANMMEVMIRDYCGRNGVAFAEPENTSSPPKAGFDTDYLDRIIWKEEQQQWK